MEAELPRTLVTKSGWKTWKKGALGGLRPDGAEQKTLADQVARKIAALAEADRSLDLQEQLKAAAAELGAV